RPLNNNEKYTWPRRSAARPAMQRDERLPFLVSSVVCVRSWLGCIARLENPFMGRVPGCHGDIMSAQCLPMRPRSLLLYWPVFHSRCCCFPRIRSWIFAVWTVRMDVDLRRNSYLRHRPHLHSRTHSRSLSTKSTSQGLTNRCSQSLCILRTFTKSDRARIIAASISFPMCCHSVGYCGDTSGPESSLWSAVWRRFQRCPW